MSFLSDNPLLIVCFFGCFWPLLFGVLAFFVGRKIGKMGGFPHLVWKKNEVEV